MFGNKDLLTFWHLEHKLLISNKLVRRNSITESLLSVPNIKEKCLWIPATKFTKKSLRVLYVKDSLFMFRQKNQESPRWNNILSLKLRFSTSMQLLTNIYFYTNSTKQFERMNKIIIVCVDRDKILTWLPVGHWWLSPKKFKYLIKVQSVYLVHCNVYQNTNSL